MAQDSTTICINGELKPGDLVISAPQDSYTGLVGTVLAVNKAGTPEHDAETDNPGDDVHVDFTTFEYPDRRIGEIEDINVLGSPFQCFGFITLSREVSHGYLLTREAKILETLTVEVMRIFSPSSLNAPLILPVTA